MRDPFRSWLVSSMRLSASCLWLPLLSISSFRPCAALGMLISISISMGLFGRTLYDWHLDHFLVDGLIMVMMCQVTKICTRSVQIMKRVLSSSFVCEDRTKVMHRVRQDLWLVFPPKVQSRILFIHTFSMSSAILFGIACRRSKLAERLNSVNSTHAVVY
jgi:hypothetical protein